MLYQQPIKKQKIQLFICNNPETYLCILTRREMITPAIVKPTKYLCREKDKKRQREKERGREGEREKVDEEE